MSNDLTDLPINWEGLSFTINHKSSTSTEVKCKSLQIKRKKSAIEGRMIAD